MRIRNLPIGEGGGKERMTLTTLLILDIQSQILRNGVPLIKNLHVETSMGLGS
jgi:hypothetical protein